MPPSMRWDTLLTRDRLGSQNDTHDAGPDRTAFQRDTDRIVFAAAFRRLQDKTQVHSLDRSDYSRTRLTHSLEVASVGRSLGSLAGATLMERHPGGAAAGGPKGILALRRQRPRLSHSHATLNPEQPGGLQLTCATLGAFLKYPRHADAAGAPADRVSAKKHGFFWSEAPELAEVATGCGLLSLAPNAWCRHPFAFLMEAADDLTYRIVDVEDGYRADCISFTEAKAVLLPLAGDVGERCNTIGRPEKQIEFLRAKAIDRAVRASVAVFLDQEDAILAGQFDAPLIDQSPLAAALDACRQVGVSKIYNHQATEALSLGVLLDYFAGAVFRADQYRLDSLSVTDRQALDALPDASPFSGDLYTRILAVTDFVSGMTDSYAAAWLARV